jgi:hypothetical protein
MSTAGDTRFFAGATSLADSGSAVFNVKSDGDITGSQVLFTGGRIASFNLSNDAFYTDNFYISSSATGNDYFISSSKFQVRASGDVSGSQVLFTGGKIGGIGIDSISLFSTDKSLVLSGSGQITGSTVLFTGGKIGGWDITSTYLSDINNILRLEPDGQYIISSSDFQVSNVGAMTASAGLVAGWDITDNYLKNGTTYVASNYDVPAGDATYFGRDTSGDSSLFFRKSSKWIHIGDSLTYPYLNIYDGSKYRVAIGDMNQD